MDGINQKNLILENEVFARPEIERRMADGGFNSLAKFELFIWDLEMFLQLQKKLGDKVLLKGGAATQFYIPISAQRTSIDIDMICLATREEVHKVISEIETEFDGAGDYCKFRFHKPKNPKLGLDDLETYYVSVPSVCDRKELFVSNGKQEVKIEFLFSGNKYIINKIKQPELFALETEKEFNILALESLFADKLTTLGPTTIGVSDERVDEQLKQIYDVITLFVSNIDQIIKKRELVKENYEKVAQIECQLHNISYDSDHLFEDMKMMIKRIKNIESDSILLQRANDFQSLYLRSSVNRDKTSWAIVGYQLDLLVEYIFNNDTRILRFRDIDGLIKILKFENVHGPERGRLIKEVRDILETNFSKEEGLTIDIFKRRIDRIIWELVAYVFFDELKKEVNKVLTKVSSNT